MKRISWHLHKIGVFSELGAGCDDQYISSSVNMFHFDNRFKWNWRILSLDTMKRLLMKWDFQAPVTIITHFNRWALCYLFCFINFYSNFTETEWMIPTLLLACTEAEQMHSRYCVDTHCCWFTQKVNWWTTHSCWLG